MNFGYGTLAKMSVEEVDGEIVVAMKDNQYIGPMPKPTDAWNRYFRATHVEGEDLYTVSALAGIFENGVITFEYGFGFQAIHPSTGASGGFFTLLMDMFAKVSFKIRLISRNMPSRHSAQFVPVT